MIFRWYGTNFPKKECAMAGEAALRAGRRRREEKKNENAPKSSDARASGYRRWAVTKELYFGQKHFSVWLNTKIFNVGLREVFYESGEWVRVGSNCF